MRITEKAQTERLNRMIREAYKLFCARGIDSVTLAEVAEKSEVSTKSVARYFVNKAGLARRAQMVLWQEITAEVLGASATRIASAKTGYEEIEILLRNFRSLYENHSDYLVFACEYKWYQMRLGLQMAEADYEVMLRPLLNTFTAAFQRGQQDGSIIKGHKAETQAETLWGIMRGLVEETVVFDRMYTEYNPCRGIFDLATTYALRAIRLEGGD